MYVGFRGKIFGAIFGVAAAAVLLVATLVSLSLTEQTYRRIEQSLVSEAHLVADVLSAHERDLSPDAIEAEATRIGKTLPARVTLIAADGTVAGDSMGSGSALATLENHATRPEVVQAKEKGVGISRRYSHTLQTDRLYVAVTVDHPRMTVVRLALPLTEVQQQVASVRHITLMALGVSLFGALALAWLASVLLGRRLQAIAGAARRVASGDLAQRVRDYEGDELGTVARVLDDTVRDLASRVAELAQDRARTDAILSGMVEGVMVVNRQGRVQLVNRAARAMLALDDASMGGHYLEALRHPGVEVDPSVAIIRTDPAKLQDAMRNLIENAVNYSPDGCRIRLEAKPSGDRVAITVSDEGPGIPESDLERIFERFYRVDKARSRESGGTGLGLLIVKHLVDLLGGQVFAANRPEGGAVFTIALPTG